MNNLRKPSVNSNASLEGRRFSTAMKALAPGGPDQASARRPSNAGAPRVSTVTRGPSLVGLLASKRFAKKMGQRFKDRRGTRLNIPKEPTYRMEPHRKFDPKKAEAVIIEVLNDRLKNFKYNPKFCANFSKIISDEIKDKIKILGFDRYKIVANVIIGQKKDVAVLVTSRCAWDEKLDNYVTYTFENEHIFCTACVYGVYSE
ncbi:dynein light chain Tctex-type protein 2B [Patella vulgata]|uniref:dynein light chain Tctex-type protein 2B n=1 Tax=Patella vulgata TaxID=6465 RepID=UPI00217F85BD|nr:dynein light chain Tctex-type protein 2B [Patella vulgata]